MRRLTVPPGGLPESGGLTLSDAQAHHAVKVLRLGPGTELELTDGAGQAALGQLRRVAHGAVQVEILRRWPVPGPPVRWWLLQGVAKAEKMDLVVRQAAELGAHRLTPVWTERSVPKKSRAVERWRRIAEDALRVSGGWRMEVEPPEPLARASERVQAAWFFDGEAERSLRQVFQQVPQVEAFGLVVGPEGGFSPGEKAAMQSRGWEGIRLGDKNLRTETAGPAVLAVLRLVGPGAEWGPSWEGP